MKPRTDLPIFTTDDENPTTCGECGTRTDITREISDIKQEHKCPCCGFEFLLEIENENMEQITDYKIFVNGILVYTCESVMGLRNLCGRITGFPSDSKPTEDLCSFLIRDGKRETYFRGKKALIELKIDITTSEG